MFTHTITHTTRYFTELTDEEILNIARLYFESEDNTWNVLDFARAIERIVRGEKV